MFEFVLNMWVMQRISSLQIQQLIGRFLTQEQARVVVASAQIVLD